MNVTVTTHHLEMLSPEGLRPARCPFPSFEIRQAREACPELHRLLYTAVGGDWYWIDRLGWNYEEWAAYANRPELALWIGYCGGTPCGYFTLETQAGGNVEICNFGLLPAFIGRGLGGQLLEAAARCAWESGARRVWVHTCTLDHASALANYQARGFRVFKTETSHKELPESPPGPWPGARAASCR